MLTYKLLWLGLNCLAGFIIAILYVGRFWDIVRINYKRRQLRRNKKEFPKKIKTSSIELIDKVTNPDGSIKIQDTIKLREKN